MKQSQLPFVTAVVCAYNGIRCVHSGNHVLSSCLESLASQSYPHDRYELLVIDDESTDGTFALVEDFIKVRLKPEPTLRLVRIKHGGLSVARNSAIRLSRGEILAFVDQDAVPASDWIENMMRPFLSGADFVGGRIDLLNGEKWQARFLQRTRYRQFFGPKILSGQFVGCNMAFRKSVFDTVGGFHENFFSYGDESTLHERLNGYFRYAPAPDASVRHLQPDSIRGAIRVNWKSAKLSRLSASSSGKKLQTKEVLLLVEQTLMTLLPASAVVALLGPPQLLAGFVLSSLALLRRFYLRPLNRAILVELVRDYGVLKGWVGHFFFCYIQNAIELTGRAAAYLLTERQGVIPPMSTELVVLRSAQSGQSLHQIVTDFDSGVGEPI